MEFDIKEYAVNNEFILAKRFIKTKEEEFKDWYIKLPVFYINSEEEFDRTVYIWCANHPDWWSFVASEMADAAEHYYG